MCVKAWKLHHSNNQMCKATWIPKAQQASVFVLRFFKHFSGLQAIERWREKYYSSGNGERPWACKEQEVPSPTPVWALRPLIPPARGQWHRGENTLQIRCGPPSQRRMTTGQGIPAHIRQPGAASRKDQAGSPALGSGASLALQRTLPQLSKDFLLPCGGMLTILTHSQPDVKGLQPVFYNIHFKKAS